MTTDGKKIEILHFGHHNEDSGPDFLNAIVKIEDTVWAGNVEIHVLSSDWEKHNHHRDDAYHNVILHVVYYHDKNIPQIKYPVPCLELQNKIPKIFYYQQLGSLTNGNYTSIHGIGLKEKYQHDFIKNQAIVLAPYIEIGGGFYQLSLVRNVNGNSFSTAVNNQTSETRLNNFSVTGDLGLNVGYSFLLLNTCLLYTSRCV